jgi:hypothetical protein
MLRYQCILKASYILYFGIFTPLVTAPMYSMENAPQMPSQQGFFGEAIRIASTIMSPMGTPMGTPRGSKENSPTKPSYKSPTKTSSPLRENGSPLRDTLNVREGGRQLNLRSPRKLVFDEIPMVDPDFERGLKLSRQFQTSDTSENHTKPYLSALPHPQCVEEIEKFVQSTLMDSGEGDKSAVLKAVLSKREPGSVLNYSLEEWGETRPFHMTLKGAEEADEDQRSQIKRVLERATFTCNSVGTLGRYIVIFLNEPTFDGQVTEGENLLLSKHLQYKVDPHTQERLSRMHISLLKITSEKPQMKCVHEGQDRINVPIPNEKFNKEIEDIKAKRDYFNRTQIEREISRAFLTFLYVKSEDVRRSLCEVRGENIHKIEHFISLATENFFRAFLNIPQIAQQYFYKLYGVTINVDKGIKLKTKEGQYSHIDMESIFDFLSNSFLNLRHIEIYGNSRFDDFQNTLRFYIYKTQNVIKRREDEIQYGRTEINSDDIFGNDQVELSEEDKESFIINNLEDKMLLRKLKKVLSYLFVKDRYYGIIINPKLFDEFCGRNEEAVTLVKKYQPSDSEYTDDILNRLKSGVGDFLQYAIKFEDYSVDRNFNFHIIFTPSIIPFLKIEEEILDTVEKEMKATLTEKIQALEYQRDHGGSLEEVTFKDSLIVDANYWRDILTKLRAHAQVLLKDTRILFSALNFQGSLK